MAEDGRGWILAGRSPANSTVKGAVDLGRNRSELSREKRDPSMGGVAFRMRERSHEELAAAHV